MEGTGQNIHGILVLLLNFFGYIYLAIHLALFTEGTQYVIFSTLTIFLIFYRAYQINARGTMKEILEYYSIIYPRIINAWKFVLVVLFILPILIYVIPFFYNLFGPTERISVVILLFFFIMTIMVETLVNDYDRSQQEVEQVIKSDEGEIID